MRLEGDWINHHPDCIWLLTKDTCNCTHFEALRGKIQEWANGR